MDRGLVAEMKDAAGTEGARRATGVSADDTGMSRALLRIGEQRRRLKIV